MSNSDEPLDVLAIHGGPRAVGSHPEIASDAVNAAIEQVVRDGTWQSYFGPSNEQLQQFLADYHKLEFVRTCASGTVAVELALRGVGVSSGDEVILGGYDFPGNFRCIEHVGGRPVLVDLGKSGCLEPAALDEAYSNTTKAILVSHLHGGLADMPAICGWAHERGLMVIEDACQAPGAVVGGRRAGAWGHVATFSFGGSKLISCGRGGAVMTSSQEMAQRIKIYAERGNDAYPLSELQAAAALPQWEALDEKNRLRRKHATSLQRLVGDADVEGIAVAGCEASELWQPSYYKFGFLVAPNVKRDDWICALQAEGVRADAGFRGFVRRSERRCRRVGELRNAARWADAGIVMHHAHLNGSTEHLGSVATAFKKIGRAFARHPS